ncbi:MAG: glycosyltransferase family 25 protein [Bacteroidota bacterium]|nr:glycosyltransferase family 25 protein [Bacteroidota bacterium]
MNNTGQIIKIYIINLKRSTERRSEMIRKLDILGLEYEFFEAIDGKNLPQETLDKIKAQPYSFKKAFNREMTAGEIGCAMSHLNLYQKIIRDEIEYALILEDDIDFDEQLQLIVSNIKTREVLKNKFDLVLLGYSANGIDYRKAADASWFGERKMSDHISFRIPTVWYWSTIGYLISDSAAKKLLAQGSLPRMPADFLTANSPKYKVRLGVANKPRIWPSEMDKFSLIGGERGHPNEIKKDTILIPANDPIKKEKRSDLIEMLKQVYRNKRTGYHKIKKSLYSKFVKIIPYHYLYVSDKF